MSKYVDKMRAVLASLNTKAMTTGNAIEAAHNQLSVANANEKVWDLREQLQQAATSARNQIAVILDEATTAAKKWAELDGRKVDTADLELLRGDFNLDDEALHRLLVKHQTNGVMVNAIAKYAKEHRIPLGNIPTVEGKIQAYNIMADGAGKMIGSIVQSMGTDAEALAEWGKSGNVSQRIDLALYGIPKE